MFIVVNNRHPRNKMLATVRDLVKGIAPFRPMFDERYLNLFENGSRYPKDVNTLYRRRYKLFNQWSPEQIEMATHALGGAFGFDNVKIVTGTYMSCGGVERCTYIHINFKDVVDIEKPEITSQKAANKYFREQLKEHPLVLADGTKIYSVRQGRAVDPIALTEAWHNTQTCWAVNGMIPSESDWSLL